MQVSLKELKRGLQIARHFNKRETLYYILAASEDKVVHAPSHKIVVQSSNFWRIRPMIQKLHRTNRWSATGIKVVLWVTKQTLHSQSTASITSSTQKAEQRHYTRISVWMQNANLKKHENHTDYSVQSRYSATNQRVPKTCEWHL